MKEKDGDLLRLIDDAIAGSEHAFAKIAERFDNYVNAIVHYKFRISSEDVPDVIQDIWVKVFKHLNGYNPHTGKFVTWFTKIAYNTSLDHIRFIYNKKNKDTVRISQLNENSALPPFLIYSTDDMEKDIFLRERVRNTERIINTLPGKQRACLVLRVYQEMKYDAIAAYMGIPIGSVKNNIFRARETIMHELKLKYTL